MPTATPALTRKPTPAWLPAYKRTRRHPVATFAGVQFLLLLAFFFPYLTGRLHFVYRDITSYFEPFARYFAASLAEGRFPLWNPLAYTGMPQIAVGHPHVFYPFTWLLIFPSFSQGLAVYLLAHLFIAGLSAFQFARALGYRDGTAAVCGIAVAWNGYMLGMFSNFQLLSAVTWIPVLLLALERVDGALTPGAMTRLLGVGASVYLLIGAGSPEVSVPAFAFALLWVGLRAWQAGRTGPWLHRLLLRLVGLGAGVLFAAPLILPALEWLARSVRRNGMPAWVVLTWSTDWLNWISVLCTHPLGGEGDALRLFFRMTRGDDGHGYYLDSPYISPVVILLAIWGVFAKGWRGKPVLLVLLALLAILTTGAHTPLGPILFRWIPMAEVVRYPVKLIIFVLGGLILLAANGFDALRRREFPGWALAASSLFGVACFLAGYILSLNYERVWPWLRPSLSDGTPFPSKLVVFVNGLLAVHLYFAGVLVLTFLILVLFHKHRRMSAGNFALWILGVVAGPLLVSAFVFERHGSPEVAYAAPGMVARYAAAPGSGFDTARHRFLVPRSHESFVVPVPVRAKVGNAVGGGNRYAAALGLYNTGMPFGIATSHGYEGAAVNDYLVLLDAATRRSGILPGERPEAGRTDRALARFAALTASKIVLESEAAPDAAPVLNEQLFHVVRHDPDLYARLYEVANIRPRWYLSHQVECLAHPAGFLDRFLDPNPQPMDNDARISFLVRPEAGPNAAAACAPRTLPVSPDAGRIELRLDRTEVLEWTVKSEQDALFVVADQFYNGWEATVDGKPAAILRANLINRGVWLPGGTHTVRMTYRPKSLRDGLWIAAGTLGAILLAMLFLQRRAPGPARA